MRATVLVILAATAALIAYDVFAYCCLPAGGTLSEVLLAAARDYPAVAFAFGFLMGHLFWPQRREVGRA